MNRNEKLGIALLVNISAAIMLWFVSIDIGFGAVFEENGKIWILAQVIQYLGFGTIVPTLAYFSREWIKTGIGGVLFGGASLLATVFAVVLLGYWNVTWVMIMLFAGALIPLINGLIVALMLDEGRV